ncbi:MAG: tRNA (adenosine(37)-N6)-threonylcarbamoyltransferase complex transferase subunit TsaD [Candidatus Omnitrophica bacterium]|nr:tRNA (adenosine(37)-N6)-threonylcarbamoyltransferase complex transferase subunit TsaD [Candidatus Omnitrophota bacterium]
MITLGIETSCDETAVAITDASMVLSNIVTSSVHLHSAFGGVVPEIASRFHLEYINAVLKESLETASVTLNDIELIAVTQGPGLIGSLLIGASFAKALSFSLSIPIIGVNHIAAHLYAVMIHYEKLDLPVIGLVVSGGHTSIIEMADIDRYRLLGQTQDDAAGEAFDKVAKILGLGYPGGPVIEKRARSGDPSRIRFPRSSLKKGSFDFSFSGIKTSVLYYVRDLAEGLQEDVINAICASFQEAVCDMITQNTLSACRKRRIQKLIVGGGVSANMALRNMLTESAKNWNIEVSFPPKGLSLDNAAMVAGLGEVLYKKRGPSRLDLIPSSSLSLQ